MRETKLTTGCAGANGLAVGDAIAAAAKLNVCAFDGDRFSSLCGASISGEKTWPLLCMFQL